MAQTQRSVPMYLTACMPYLVRLSGVVSDLALTARRCPVDVTTPEPVGVSLGCQRGEASTTTRKHGVSPRAMSWVSHHWSTHGKAADR